MRSNINYALFKLTLLAVIYILKLLIMSNLQGAALTINNPTPAHRALVEVRRSGECLLKDRCEKKKIRVSCWIGVERAPSTNTEHLQIGAFCEGGLTKLQWQRLFTPAGLPYTGVWCGPQMPSKEKGPSYWKEYTSKDEALPTLIIGDEITDDEYADWYDARPVLAQGKRNDLGAIKDAIDSGTSVGEIIATTGAGFAAGAKHLQFFMHYEAYKKRRIGFVLPEVFVFYGATGTGKTRKAYEDTSYDMEETWRWTPGCGTTFFDGYCGQDNVIFDEFRGQLPLGNMLTLLDGYPMTVQIKGSSVHWSPTKVIITSPIHPKEWYTSMGEDKIEQLLRRITKVTRFSSIV